jgi:transposase
VCIRIQLSRSTVKDRQSRLQQAYQKDDVRLVRRTTVLLDLLVHHVPVEVLCERWGLSPACLSTWRQDCMRHGVDSLVYPHGGGRRTQLTPRQRKRLLALLEAGPQVVGFASACWNSTRIRVLIWREFGVLYKRHYVWTLLPNMGFSFHKARLVSDHRDAARRQAWLRDVWPTILRAAQRRKGLLLFADEASLAPWGSLSYPWARRGHQPEVPTSGKRKGYKVFGAIDYFSGHLFSPGIEGRFNAESYQAFWQTIMAQTTAHLFLLHDGARYHTSQATQPFFAEHADRLTVHPLPSSSPDSNPMEYLWKKTKQRATHNKYCKAFVELTVSGDKALAYCATHPETVLGLCGRYCEESGLELKQAA